MASRSKTTRKMLPEFEFRINVKYDQEFRSREANQRLRKNHPKVKKIHVAHRDDAKKSRDGNKYVTVTIAAPTRAIAKTCFDEGNSRVLRRMENNRSKRANARSGNRSGRGNARSGNRSRRANARSSKRSRRANARSRRTPPKPKSKTPSPENTRPVHWFSEAVTHETDWAEYMERCDEYQKKHPEVKVIC